MSKISGIETHCAFDKSVDVVDLTPHPRNPNKHDDKQIALLAKIIRSQGWRNPIVVSERSGFIISGHGRLEAAKMLDVEQVPVDLQAFENEAEEYAHLIADNRIAELAETDRDELAELIRELDGEIDLDLTGFDEPSLAELMGESAPDGDEVDAEPQIDKADELQKKWNTALGQVWELGDHRLLCGDSTNKESIDLVMGGEVIDMVFTDPPYGLGGYGGRNNMRLEGDDEDPTKFYHSVPDAPEVYVWGRVENWQHINFKPRDVIVWKKNNFGLGRGYRGQYEVCFYKGGFNGSDSDVWEENKDTKYLHPTQKPIDLSIRAIKNSKPKSVLDIFAGSGSTILGCENLGRKCRAIEIDPGYVAVALERWAEATGKTPKLTDGA